MAVKKKFALGRGLDALISTETVNVDGSSTINEVNLDLIDANPDQPRREFDEETLQELADSIQEIGIIQPITLRAMDNGRYQIIAGERRWRASQLAGLHTIPAYVRTADDENVMEMALIENIQRQDLNSIEIALAYQRLIDRYGLTQEKLSERVGKKRATVANFLRLLRLPAPVQVALQNRQIDNGHARALLSIEDPKDQVRVFKDIQTKGYSVRQVEELVKALKDENANCEPKSSKKSLSMVLPQEIEKSRAEVSLHLNADVKVACGVNGSGKLTISFKSLKDLQRIFEIIK